jgi:hypothetical protein
MPQEKFHFNRYKKMEAFLQGAAAANRSQTKRRERLQPDLPDQVM